MQPLKRLALLCIAGLATGFAVTARHEIAEACSCAPIGSQLKLVDTSAGIDRTKWSFENTFLSRNGRGHTIHAFEQYELELREAP